ncbi:MAG TPA: tRNA-dihydrouridine synthase, partial [Gammaproteobacteria bacterium]
ERCCYHAASLFQDLLLPMRILLAPMEGVLDAPMRRLLTAIGGYDACVTEFIRVSDSALDGKALLRHCPELAEGGTTASGTPVLLQLLGSEPQLLAQSAVAAVAAGAAAIDLNFGCPSRFVNRNRGGAALLKEPQQMAAIIAAVRKHVPAHLPVSAKIRLGYETPEYALDLARAVQEAGASFVTVHARTREDGYRHPARWEWLGRIREAITIPLIANGDINSVEDYRQCRAISGCEDVMLGRGALMQPDLALQLRAATSSAHPHTPMRWCDIPPLFARLAQLIPPGNRSDVRLKQWLGMMKLRHQEAERAFAQIRTLHDSDAILAALASG